MLSRQESEALKNTSESNAEDILHVLPEYLGTIPSNIYYNGRPLTPEEFLTLTGSQYTSVLSKGNQVLADVSGALTPPIELAWVSDSMGFGLRAREDIPCDTFIAFYVGQVYDLERQFSFDDVTYALGKDNCTINMIAAKNITGFANCGFPNACLSPVSREYLKSEYGVSFNTDDILKLDVLISLDIKRGDWIQWDYEDLPLKDYDGYRDLRMQEGCDFFTNELTAKELQSISFKRAFQISDISDYRRLMKASYFFNTPIMLLCFLAKEYHTVDGLIQLSGMMDEYIGRITPTYYDGKLLSYSKEKLREFEAIEDVSLKEIVVSWVSEGRGLKCHLLFAHSESAVSDLNELLPDVSENLNEQIIALNEYNYSETFGEFYNRGIYYVRTCRVSGLYGDLSNIDVFDKFCLADMLLGLAENGILKFNYPFDAVKRLFSILFECVEVYGDLGEEVLHEKQQKISEHLERLFFVPSVDSVEELDEHRPGLSPL
ncbi:MAG: hypothetical protein ACE365_03960 [Gammaproteobacteria bacterium]